MDRRPARVLLWRALPNVYRRRGVGAWLSSLLHLLRLLSTTKSKASTSTQPWTVDSVLCVASPSFLECSPLTLANLQVMLLAATVLSLYLANSSHSQSWLAVWSSHVGPASLGLHLSTREWVRFGVSSLRTCRGTVHASAHSLWPVLGSAEWTVVSSVVRVPASLPNQVNEGLMAVFFFVVGIDIKSACA